MKLLTYSPTFEISLRCVKCKETAVLPYSNYTQMFARLQSKRATRIVSMHAEIVCKSCAILDDNPNIIRGYN